MLNLKEKFNCSKHEFIKKGLKLKYVNKSFTSLETDESVKRCYLIINHQLFTPAQTDKLVVNKTKRNINRFNGFLFLLNELF